ncbi:nitroreductase family protein [Bifidobacterium sp. 82T24]|uniref:nitroreductase family protein n=1 Tax=Bifidobacterium pluvialisilvae TaxID=2834436 RepID=UPI001C57E2EA|nr:nitroreductase family protein [Bifidobacterium pluvialisilvae]MBW3088401.1 nitroreductase family protein [Bifidobacterium pluvialisilvae]
MANTSYDLHNPTIETLLNRRSIRAFADEAIPDDVVDTLESVAQHAASSQYLNDWSAIRISDSKTAAKLAEIGKQPYIAQAPLLYVFVLDEHRNAQIAAAKGVDVDSDAFTLNGSYRFSQAQNDAVLALHAMETAAYSLGLGCVILGSLLNDVDALIDVLKLPKYTYPVLGLAIGKPAQEPALKPRMPKSVQFFENEYPQSFDDVLTTIADFDADVHQYYDLRNTERPVDAFSDQIAKNAVADMTGRTVGEPAARQGFRLDR